jgi:glycosyltransferase involved in cell wall biosynthesis
VTPVRSVLMTADTVGGVFTYALTLAEALGREGVRVTLATMGDALRPAQRAAVAALPDVDLRESTYALEWMDDPWEDVRRAGAWLLDLEREVRPDVVHLNGYAHAAEGFSAPVVVAAHSCVLSWWEAVLGGDAPARYNRYRSAVRRGLLAADAVVAPSAAMLAALAKHHGPLPDGVVVPNGSPAPAESATVKVPAVLCAGRLWDRAKNLEALARVAPRLPWPVVAAGSDLHPDGTRRPLPGVRALGWLDGAALGAEMDRASVFALPARYEPFGLSALEAALRGCALVLGDIASLREVWGDAALFVAPDDDDALARAIERLARDPGLLAEMADRARARAARYTPERMARAQLAVYARLRAPERTLAPCAS